MNYTFPSKHSSIIALDIVIIHNKVTGYEPAAELDMKMLAIINLYSYWKHVYYSRN
jgi:hypothetical protein